MPGTEERRPAAKGRAAFWHFCFTFLTHKQFSGCQVSEFYATFQGFHFLEGILRGILKRRGLERKGPLMLSLSIKNTVYFFSPSQFALFRLQLNCKTGSWLQLYFIKDLRCRSHAESSVKLNILPGDQCIQRIRKESPSVHNSGMILAIALPPSPHPTNTFSSANSHASLKTAALFAKSLYLIWGAELSLSMTLFSLFINTVSVHSRGAGPSAAIRKRLWEEEGRHWPPHEQRVMPVSCRGERKRILL